MKVTVLPYIDTTSADTAPVSENRTTGTAAASEAVITSASTARKDSDFSISLQTAERALTAMTIDLVTSLDDVEKIQNAARILSASKVTQLQEIGQALLGQSSTSAADESTPASENATVSTLSEENKNTSADNTELTSTGTSTDTSGADNDSGTSSWDSIISPECSDISSKLGCPSNLQTYFQEASDKYEVDVALLESIAKAESNFRTDAKSSAGAAGVMQLMPSTAKGLGVSDSYDAQQNIMGGAKLISGLLKKYDGDTSLALAAYNAGSGNVAKYGGIPPFKETQNYVVKVLGYYKDATS